MCTLRANTLYIKIRMTPKFFNKNTIRDPLHKKCVVLTFFKHVFGTKNSCYPQRSRRRATIPSAIEPTGSSTTKIQPYVISGYLCIKYLSRRVIDIIIIPQILQLCLWQTPRASLRHHPHFWRGARHLRSTRTGLGLRQKMWSQIC